MIQGKRVLVTGGTGSIGSELVRQLLQTDVSWIGILTNDENSLVQAKRDPTLRDSRLRFFLGDVREKERLYNAMNGVHYVFHAAAIKHVDIAEYDPFEAIKTNVLGTQNIIQVALELNVEKVVGISTDKAAGPINVMGASKLLSEKLLIAANNIKGSRQTVFSAVRFGNVIGSRGSILEIIKNKIQKKEPITITDPRMTRFIMTIQEAVHLVLEHTTKAIGGEVEILKMPTVTLETLIQASINVVCQKYGYDPQTIETKIIGARPGEKIHEELLTIDESRNALETPSSYVLIPPFLTSEQTRNYWITQHHAKPAEEKPYTSASPPFMDQPTLESLLTKIINDLY